MEASEPQPQPLQEAEEDEAQLSRYSRNHDPADEPLGDHNLLWQINDPKSRCATSFTKLLQKTLKQVTRMSPNDPFIKKKSDSPHFINLGVGLPPLSVPARPSKGKGRG